MFKSTLILTVFTLLSSLLGFLNQLLYANFFGMDKGMDIFYSMLSIPNVVIGIAPLIFISIFIPLFSSIDKLLIDKLIIVVLVFLSLFVVFFSTMGNYFTVNLYSLNNSNLEMIRTLSILVWAASGLSFLNGYLLAILNFEKQFKTIAIASIFPSLFITISIFIFHQYINVVSIAFGLFLGNLLQFIIYFYVVFIVLKVRYNKSNLAEIKFGSIFVNFLYTILSLLPFTSMIPIAYKLAEGINEGSVSVIGYSQSFAGFLSTATSLGISMAVFPELSKNIEIKNEEVLINFEEQLKYLLLISFFIAFLFISIQHPLFNLFYQRGKFSAEKINDLLEIVPFFILGAIFISGLNFLRTFLYSKKQYSNMSIIGILVPIIFCFFGFFFKKYYSIIGISVSYLITYILFFLAYVILAKMNTTNFLRKTFYVFLIKNILINSIIVLVLYFLLQNIKFINSQILLLFLIISIYLLIYFILGYYIFKIKEFIFFVKLLLNKINLNIK